MSRLLLLDTCALLWSVTPDARFRRVDDDLRRAKVEGGVIVSPITAWEIGQLVARGRLALMMPPAEWFAAALEELSLAPLTPEILIQSSFLPHSPLRDPGDRIIAATARALGCAVVTRDRLLLDYAEAGWIAALAC